MGELTLYIFVDQHTGVMIEVEAMTEAQAYEKILRIVDSSGLIFPQEAKWLFVEDFTPDERGMM